MPKSPEVNQIQTFQVNEELIPALELADKKIVDANFYQLPLEAGDRLTEVSKGRDPYTGKLETYSGPTHTEVQVGKVAVSIYSISRSNNLLQKAFDIKNNPDKYPDFDPSAKKAKAVNSVVATEGQQTTPYPRSSAKPQPRRRKGFWADFKSMFDSTPSTEKGW